MIPMDSTRVGPSEIDSPRISIYLYAFLCFLRIPMYPSVPLYFLSDSYNILILLFPWGVPSDPYEYLRNLMDSFELSLNSNGDDMYLELCIPVQPPTEFPHNALAAPVVLRTPMDPNGFHGFLW